jgi:4'-phosphopantetheinyl transferase
VTGTGAALQLWLLPRDEDRLRRCCQDGAGLLSEAERERVERAASPVLARRFLLGRVLMRRALGAHLDADPRHLVIAPDRAGKPEVVEPACPGLVFNLSHSQREWVIALARGQRLGVDLEPMIRAASMRKIAEAFYSVPEQQRIARQGEHAATNALQLWTLKEAVVKAMGSSLWEGLRGVRFEIDAGCITWLEPPPEGKEAAWSVALGSLRQDHWLGLALKSSAEPAPHLSVSCSVLDEEAGGETPLALHSSSRVVRPHSGAG